MHPHLEVIATEKINQALVPLLFWFRVSFLVVVAAEPLSTTTINALFWGGCFVFWV
jgi:uncharacterized membrane protein